MPVRKLTAEHGSDAARLWSLSWPAEFRGKRCQGFSLLELLMVITITGTISAAMLSVYLASGRELLSSQRQAQLNHNIRASLYRMTSELKRAGGFVPAAFSGQSGFMYSYQHNPFMSDSSTLRLAGNQDGYFYDCVIFSYDSNKDGLVGVSSNHAAPVGTGENTVNMEQSGFRLHDGALEVRTSRNTIINSEFSCEDSGGRWSDLTEAGITVTRLALAWLDDDGNIVSQPVRQDILTGQACQSGQWCLETRHLSISLSAQAPGTEVVTAGGQVRVRNDRVFIYP